MADLVELHRSKVTNEANGSKTFWQRYHGSTGDAVWTNGDWAATYSTNATGSLALTVGYELPSSAGYYVQSIDLDPRPDNMPGRVLSTVVWRKFEDYA